MIELDDSKKYLYGIEDEIRHELGSFEKKIDCVRKQCETFHSDQILDNKSLESEIKTTLKTFDSVYQENNRINDIQRSFYNFCSLVNHLQIQDEIDKQNISLMGINENSEEANVASRNRNSIIEVDKKCFSCCGYPASTLSAFKMACLAYNPSSIFIDSK